jgi:hypothetical protein
MTDSTALAQADVLGGVLWLFFSAGLLIRAARWLGSFRGRRDGRRQVRTEMYASRRPASEVPAALPRRRAKRP